MVYCSNSHAYFQTCTFQLCVPWTHYCLCNQIGLSESFWQCCQIKSVTNGIIMASLHYVSIEKIYYSTLLISLCRFLQSTKWNNSSLMSTSKLSIYKLHSRIIITSFQYWLLIRINYLCNFNVLSVILKRFSVQTHTEYLLNLY